MWSTAIRVLCGYSVDCSVDSRLEKFALLFALNPWCDLRNCTVIDFFDYNFLAQLHSSRFLHPPSFSSNIAAFFFTDVTPEKF